MWETAMMRYKVAGEYESDLAMCLRLSFKDLTRNRPAIYNTTEDETRCVYPIRQQLRELYQTFCKFFILDRRF